MNVGRFARALAAVAVAVFLADATADDGKETAPPPCRAEAVAKTTSLRPGVETTIGVRLVLAERWHVYWKNPGESGVATSVEWTLPKGFEASPMVWPAPHRVESDGIVGYVYEGEVLFPFTLKVPADAKPGDVVLSARVQWLVCREVCEPGDVRVELKLPVKDAAPVDDPARTAQFAAAAASLPRALPAGAATIESTAERVTLTVAAADVPTESVRSVEFFPEEQLVLDDASTATLESTKKTQLRVRLTPAPRRDGPVARLKGVLVAKTPQRSFAFYVDAAPAKSQEPGTPGEKSPK
jgi:thiol:disulfide interchange protein DsbD